MANQRYDYGSERFLTAQLNWIADNFKVVLVDTKYYTFLKNVHRTLADVPLAARVATSGTMTGMTAIGGVARADSTVVLAVSGQHVEAMIIYHDTGVESTSELVVYLDTANGLPFNPDGNSVTIGWDAGPSGIYVL